MQARGYLRVARNADSRTLGATDRTSAPLMRARIAAAAAVRLTRQAVEDLTVPRALYSTDPQSLDDLDTCVRATWQCIAILSAGVAADDPVRQIVAEAVAHLNMRCGQRASGATYAEQCLLLEIVEQILIGQLADLPGSNLPVPAAAEARHVDQLILTVVALTNDRWDVAVHVLVGVALRAIARARSGCWSTHERAQRADISTEEPA